VKHVKLLNWNPKPSAVELIHPIVCQHKDEKPYEQNSVVDYGTPQKQTANRFDSHDLLPDCFQTIQRQRRLSISLCSLRPRSSAAAASLLKIGP